MSAITPLITFKGGICEVDQSSKPYKVHPQPTPGYIYLYTEDELCHFCWRPRNAPPDEPELDLIMVPGDGNFVPYDTLNPAESTSKTNGRIFVLKFQSSSARHIFWLQSKPQGRKGNPAWISPRDRKIGEIVDKLLQGEEVDVNRELASVTNNNDDEDAAHDNDETMEDVEGTGDSNEHHEGGNGGAGPDATGGDFRKEGSGAREGGADGARAATSDPAALVRNLLDSLKGGGQGLGGGQSQGQGKIYPMLTDLLDTATTLRMVDECSDKVVDSLMSYLPPTVVVLAQQGDNGDAISKEPGPADVAAALEAMSVGQKRALLKQVLRSPQFHQSLDSLSLALREGALPSIAQALGLEVENGGLIRGGTMPLGGGEAIEAFVNGVKRKVQRSE